MVVFFLSWKLDKFSNFTSEDELYISIFSDDESLLIFVI